MRLFILKYTVKFYNKYIIYNIIFILGNMIKVNQTNMRVKNKRIFMCSAHILIHLKKKILSKYPWKLLKIRDK